MTTWKLMSSSGPVLEYTVVTREPYSLDLKHHEPNWIQRDVSIEATGNSCHHDDPDGGEPNFISRGVSDVDVRWTSHVDAERGTALLEDP